MKQILLLGGLPLVAAVALTGCIDDKYDLSDIDTTSQFKVKDLVIPINIDPVTLGDIIEIKEGEQIKEITLNGKTFYAIRESGEFRSDPIDIPGFSTDAPSIGNATMEFHAPSYLSGAAEAPSVTMSLGNPIERNIKYSASGIDKSIVALSDLYSDISIELLFDIDNLPGIDIEMTNIMLQLPKGLTISSVMPNGEYNSTEGELTIQSIPFKDGKGSVVLKASCINLEANDARIDNHSLEINANVNIKEATVKASIGDGDVSSIPSSLSFDVSYKISPLEVKAVSGEIQYTLEGNGLNISPISLSSIPDFLSGEGTNLILANPQIYLNLNNPVADYNLSYQSGIKLTSVRNGVEDGSYTLDDGFFRVGSLDGVAGPYNFCLSPEEPLDIPKDFLQNFQHIAFSSLSDVVSGNGIPQEVRINLVDPQIPSQKVEKFELDNVLQPLEGKWEFLAPLAMKAGTDAKIIYSDIVDGWWSEDLDALTIETLEVNVNVTNDTSLEAVLSGFPIGKDGKQIAGVVIEGAKISGNAKQQPVTLRITGQIKGLDGINFTATVTPSSDNPIAPEQSITLSEIRAKVSGNYTKDF